MTDIQMMRAVQCAMHLANVHTGIKRDTSYVHASALNDCLERVRLENEHGSIPWEADERTLDVFAWGVALEKIVESLVLPHLDGSEIAHIGIKGRHGKFRAEDNGLGRESPTFKYDIHYNLGGSVDRAIILSPARAQKLSDWFGYDIKPYSVVPWEMKSILEVTPAGGRAGEMLLLAAEQEERGEGSGVFTYMFAPDNPAMRWLRKWVWQVLAYLYLWNAPVALLTIFVKGRGRAIPVWIPRHHGEIEAAINSLLSKLKLIKQAVKGERDIDKTTDWQLCNWCPFQQTCIPEIIKRDVKDEIKDPLVVDMIDRYMHLMEQDKELASLKRLLAPVWRQYLPEDKPAEYASKEDSKACGFKAGQWVVKITRTLSHTGRKTFREKMESEGKSLDDPVGHAIWKYDAEIMPGDKFKEA